MLFLVSKYQIEGKTYLLDVEGLRKILDRKRGNIGLEKYINSLPEELDPPKGRTVSDWLNNKHEPRDVQMAQTNGRFCGAKRPQGASLWPRGAAERPCLFDL